jgi:hypothetical protein
MCCVHCAGPTKMYLLLRAPAGFPAPPGFTVRHGHQLKLRKGFQVGAAALV